MTRRNIFRSMAMAVMAAAALSSCDVETSDNGDLDGYWHLNRIDTISTGGVCDMSGKLIYWGVQVNLLFVTDRSTQAAGYLFRFEHRGDTLRLYDPHKDNREEGDPAVTSPDVLRPFGINAIDTNFGVESISSSRLTLFTNELKLYFNKM